MKIFPNAKRNSARTLGYNLLHDENIGQRIAELRDERSKLIQIDSADIVNKLKVVVNADYTKFIELGQRGVTREELEKIPIEIRRLVTQIQVRKDRSGQEIVNFKMIDKTKALEMLAKHTGTYSDAPTVAVQVNNITDMLSKVNDEDIEI